MMFLTFFNIELEEENFFRDSGNTMLFGINM